MHALPFDRERLRATGSAVRIADNVTLTGTGLAQFAAADNGTIVYVPEEQRSLVLVDRDGRSRPATPDRRNYHSPMFSPDGRRIATDFTSPDGRDVWIVDLQGGVTSRATFDRDGHDAVWTPDGQAINYASASDGTQGVYRAHAGSSGRELLYAFPQTNYSGLWLDNRTLVTVTIQTGSPEAGAYDLSLVRLGASAPVLEPLLATRFTEDRPALSRNGTWMAFTANHSGRDEVYVRRVAGGDQVQVSVSGGIEPVWGLDGELFYRSNEAKGVPMLIRASVVTAPTFAVTSRQTLFSVADIATAIPHRNYDISPDGRTFAMVRYNPATRIMVIQNLPALVRKLGGASAAAR
jgi:Tol biopolymer transport system component